MRRADYSGLYRASTIRTEPLAAPIVMDVGAGLIRTVQAAITLGAMVAARDSYPGFESVFGLTAGKHQGKPRARELFAPIYE